MVDDVDSGKMELGYYGQWSLAFQVVKSGSSVEY